MARARRDAAERELGATAASRTTAAWLAAVFCATLLAAAAAEHASHLAARGGKASGGWPQAYDAIRLVPTWAQLSRVRTVSDAWALVPELREIAEYEDALEDTSLLSAAILPRAQLVLTKFAGAGNEQVYVGRGGELYYRPDVDYITGRAFLSTDRLALRAAGGAAWEAPPAPDPRPAIRALRDALDARGIRLLVVPIPVKPVLQAGALAGQAHDAYAVHNPSYARFLDGLRADGIHVYDPTRDVGALQRPYLRADSHWTPRAMEAAAAGVARHVSAEGSGPPQAPVLYKRRPKRVANVGDVAAMLKLSPGDPLTAPEVVEIHEVVRRDGTPWRPTRTARVLLLGDSFTNIYSLGAMGWGEGAGLAEQLSYALQEPVDRIALNAGGARAAREALAQALARGEDRLAGKDVVIYTFAARELFSGDWRVFDMPCVSAPPVAPVAARLVVDAVVAARSTPPAPRSVPYPDCIIALHATDIQPVGPPTLPAEAVVFMWGMRDDAWTPAAGIDVGSRVRLGLTPWADVEGEYGSYSRRELEDEDTWLLDVYWGEIVP